MRDYLIIASVGLLILLVAYNFLLINEVSSAIDQKMVEIKEAQKKPVLTMTVVRAQECEDCFDIQPLLDAIQSLDVNLTVVEKDQTSAASLGVNNLPAIILEGETEVLPSNLMQLFNQSNDKLVFESLPPYYDVSEQRVVGKVSAVVVSKPDCVECRSYAQTLQDLQRAMGMFISSSEFSYDSQEGQQLLEQYNLTKVPVLLLDKEADFYGFDRIAKVRSQIQDLGEYYLIEPFPPYYDLSEDKVRGLVSAKYLYDESCDNCIGVAFFRDIVRRMNLYMVSEEDVEISQAQELISQLNITYVPTMVLSGDLEAYPGFEVAWRDLGNVVDGNYIFTNFELLGDVTYKDLSEGAVVGDVDKTIEVSGSEFSFSPDSISVSQGEKVKIVFTNTGSVPHNFVIEELGIESRILSPGESQAIIFTASRSGTFSFYCSVGNHRAQGMEGTFEVA